MTVQMGNIKAAVADAFTTLSFCLTSILFCSYSKWYGDGAGNTVEENSSIFSLIRMR